VIQQMRDKINKKKPQHKQTFKKLVEIKGNCCGLVTEEEKIHEKPKDPGFVAKPKKT
jgi:hypothetical protein